MNAAPEAPRRGTRSRGETRRRAARGFYALAIVLAGLAVVVPGAPVPAVAEAGVSRTVTATRVAFGPDGQRTELDSRTVTLNVAQTTNLRGRQEVRVTWSGAHPTGATVADPNSSDGRNQEYPFVLLQCRGIDTDGAVPRGQSRLSPETCWTQTSPERYVAAASSTPSWRFDAFAPAAERGPVVGEPSPLPAGCAGVSQAQSARWLPFRAVDGTVYYGGPDPGVGCSPLAPESDSAERGGLPSNTTYAVTGADGKGEADFAVWTRAENASLGCTAEVKCSLVAVPIVGVSCDAFGTLLPAGQVQQTRTGAPLTPQQLTAADTTCRRTGTYQPGEPVTGRASDQAVRGNLWWAPSNWRNRISVPLEFAPTAEVCSTTSTEKPLEMLGSVALNELTASWRPRFCTDRSLYSFTHVQQADALARDLVQGGDVAAAFSTAPEPGGYQRPVVQAPLAFGGFAIAFTIDDPAKQRREKLRLNARLVAKLLTGSYPATSFMRTSHVGLENNPFNISDDPEFQALNPGLPVRTTQESAAAMQILSSSSDLVWALTRWLDADPEARAFLDGARDPWGMRVNPAYKDIDLPVDNWPLLDDVEAPAFYTEQNPCYRNSPTPYLQLVLNPLATLGAINLNLQFGNSAVATVCRFDGVDATTLPLRTEGRQAVGFRFVLGLTTLSAARRYNLRTASLQTSSTVAPGTKFTDATGRTFADGDTAGLRSAASLLRPDASGTTWEIDQKELAKGSSPKAYPGALPVYAVVPTSSVAPATATKLAKFLCYAAERGQTSGLGNGQLPPGYLPVTAANGFTQQRDYLASSIAAVRAQAGAVPALDAVAPSFADACNLTAKPPAVDDGSKDDAAPNAGVGAPIVPVVPELPVATDAAAAPAGGAVSPAATPTTVDAATALTSAERSDLGRLGLPGLILLAALSALAGTVLRWLDELRALLAGGLTSARGRLGPGMGGGAR